MSDAAPASIFDILRPYQKEAIGSLREGALKKLRRQLLASPTGSGKTEMAMVLVQECLRKGKRVWFIVDRVTLVDQTSRRFDSHGIEHGVIQADHPLTDPKKLVQIVSVQTLGNRLKRLGDHLLPDLIVWDECFPAGTMISTARGNVPIEDVVDGDVVLNAIGRGVVKHKFARPAYRQMATVSFEDGTEIHCTADHRFFTLDAWVEARFLAGKSVVGIEAMPDLWREHASLHQSDEARRLAGPGRGDLECSDVLLQKLCEEIEQSDAHGGEPRQDGADIARHRAQAEAAWREWIGSDRSAEADAGGARAGMGGRACRQHGASAEFRGAEPLQDRRRESGFDDRDRVGRREPLQPVGSATGCEEGRLLGIKRVVSVQVDERPSEETVFNLHVSGHPSYFADGLLVHNCHAVYKGALELIARAAAARVIGLSATPFTAGMDSQWDGLVNSTTVNKLLAEGFLSPLRIKACVTPDMKDARLRKGEYVEEDAGARGITIIGNVVETWVEQTRIAFGGPVKTIVFSPSVKHGDELRRQFAAAGFNFQQISYLDGDDADRDRKIAEFRKPDSAIHGLISCAVLTKGFDVPDILCGISCRPYRKSFSSHIQEMGRAMRTSKETGKEFALWLDHSGNCLTFEEDTAWLFEYGVDSLSKASKQDSVVREPKERPKTTLFCRECGMQMEAKAEACPACGWEKPRRGEIQIVQGELIDLDVTTRHGFAPRAGLRAECLADPQRMWTAALAYTSTKSRRGADAARKWAMGIWADIYPNNKLPRGLYDAPCDPSGVRPDEWSLIDREVARFRKKGSRRAA